MSGQNTEVAQSLTSYAVGGGVAGLSFLDKMTDVAADVAILVGCLVVIVRVIHDTHRYIRFLNK